MSDFNISWLKENFPDTSIVIFDIGCADLSDSIRFRRYLPHSQIYSFECSPIWQLDNQKLSSEYQINYFNLAVSDETGESHFWPCRFQSNNDVDRYAGSMIPESNPNKIWESPVIVKTISFNEFCQTNQVIPDFIHIDVEGMEPRILSSIDNKFLPKIIWAENVRDQTQRKNLQDTMFSRGFDFFDDGYDTLYWQKGSLLSRYQPIRWDEDPFIDLPLAEKEFLDAYRFCKNTSWPEISSFDEFLSLSEDIKKQCFDSLVIDHSLLLRYNLN